MENKTIGIVGSGNWGSAIAKILGRNVQERAEMFNSEIRMYMYEEMIDGRKLTEIVNTDHENVKYLPGIKLPENVVAIPDLLEATTGADILVFVLPHQYVKKICSTLKGNIKSNAVAVSLIKGFSIHDDGVVVPMSKVISEALEIPCAALSGANLATEVAQEQFCESTIGCDDEDTGQLLKDLFETPYFRVAIVQDRQTVEACGALKNIVGIGAGIVDGLGYGDNTKAAVIRLGLMEMIKATEMFIPEMKVTTFFESCGIADLVATCHGGRNRLLGESVISSDKTIKQLEKELMKGQSFQGPLIAREIYTMLEKRNMTDKFPLFTAIHKICIREMDPKEFISCLRNHPEHL
ncbi:glycerol-3-phosphate dehydrogenase [NAD(+)], cytoplasmic-like [Ostrea edulis]|uniref:glycerol-3-phosphate dehydrogenase [NAD(+)], cytoplasmic-like n=1 Tax=Ostrea edulis TaxID=37623 RepID=UPI002095C2D5|nr:glycerol-3-phosphate dehydrogenase [NAD(+)], cytoplasmic-like [Ostrea edulis]